MFKFLENIFRPKLPDPVKFDTRNDNGFFGPDSIAWKVWLYPTAPIFGFARSVTIQHLDPDLSAAVAQTGQVVKRTPVRYDRTMEYFTAVLFSDAETVVRASDVLMKIHERAVGHNPVTNQQYDSNKPSSQLWIHVTAWHSILKTYEMYGPGKLSRDEENQYWQECAISAAFQPINLDEVPKTRGEVQAYLDSWRDRLSASEVAITNIQHINNGTRTAFIALPWGIRIFNFFLRSGIKSTYPQWMRDMMGSRQSKYIDALVIPTTRLLMRFLQSNTWAYAFILSRITPSGYTIIYPILAKTPPKSTSIYKPETARRKFSAQPSPLEQYSNLLEKRSETKFYDHNHKEPLPVFRPAKDQQVQ